MPKETAKTAERRNDWVYFWCPGCDENHWIRDSAGGWTFNGNFERPTFSPSVLVTWDPPVPQSKAGQRDPRPRRCHSFVKDGRIQFLNDCTHALAGKTVDLPPIEPAQRSETNPEVIS